MLTPTCTTKLCEGDVEDMTLKVNVAKVNTTSQARHQDIGLKREQQEKLS